jgi:hypothetical protein
MLWLHRAGVHTWLVREFLSFLRREDEERMDEDSQREDPIEEAGNGNHPV